MMTLAVDKLKKRVAVLLFDQSQMSGFIFLSAFSPLGVGEQTILDALLAEERFIPFETVEGEVSLINRDQIVWLSYPSEESPTTLLSENELRPVTVCMHDGKRISGNLIMAMPEEKSRLSDWLNAASGFLLIRDVRRDLLINLNYISKVIG